MSSYGFNMLKKFAKNYHKKIHTLPSMQRNGILIAHSCNTSPLLYENSKLFVILKTIKFN